MASNATLTIKVGANVKDAAQQLQALGYNIETVKKKTDKANDSASLWSQTMKKGSEDSVRKIVETGAKFLTVSTIITGVYKGIKSCVSEALKENEEAQKKIDKINEAWTGVQRNLGNALLDSITPALDALYKMLLKIEEWAEAAQREASYTKSLKSARDSFNESGTIDLTSWTDANMEKALKNIWTTAGEEWSTYTMEFADALTSAINAEIKAREKSNKIIDESAKTVETSVGNASDSLKTISDRLIDKEVEDDLTILGYSETREKIIKLMRLQSLANTAQEMIDAGSIDAPYYQEALEAINEQIENLANETATSWSDAFSDIYSSALSCFSGIFSLTDAYYDNQIEQIENSEMAEEEKNAKLNEIEKKKFQAEQANSYANATISFAEGLVDIWSKYASAPWIGATLSALLTANTGMQFATISQQTYTPSLAEGGIVTSPTHAFIGEGAEHEAVIPLSKLEDFVNRDREGGAIYLNITCSGGSKEEDVFRAIERAQRTGLLPHWRYA